jgi:hypothetical protein
MDLDKTARHFAKKRKDIKRNAINMPINKGSKNFPTNSILIKFKALPEKQKEII